MMGYKGKTDHYGIIGKITQFYKKNPFIVSFGLVICPFV